MRKFLMFNKEENAAGGGGADADVEELTLEDVITAEQEPGGEAEGGNDEGADGAGAEGADTGAGADKGKKADIKKSDIPLSLSRFQEVDKEIDSEDKLLDSYIKVHQENKQLKLLAQGREAIEKDEEIKGWRQWINRGDDELYQAELVNQYTRHGNLTKEAAIEKAKERLATAKEKNPQEIEDTAMRVRAGLKEAIQGKEEHYVTELQKAGKTLDLTKIETTVIDTARKQLSKTESFLGMKISKNEVERKKMLGEVDKVIASDDLQKALKDPDFLIQVALLRKYGPQYAAAIAARGNGKAKVILGLPKAPASAGAGAGKKVVAKKDKSDKGFNPKDFK